MLRDNIEGRQEPLDRHQRRFGHIANVSLEWESRRVRRLVQHLLQVLADSEPVVIAEPGGQLSDVGIVRVNLAPRFGYCQVPGNASFRDPTLPGRLILLISDLSLIEVALGLLIGTLKAHAPADHPLQAARSPGSVVSPLRYRDRVSVSPKIQRLNGYCAPHRLEAHPRSPRQR